MMVCNYEEFGFFESLIEIKVLFFYFDKRLFCYIEEDILFYN